MITKGKQTKAQKVVIYGPEGIGKTTIAAAFPTPLFIDTEGGTAHFDVARTEQPISFTHFDQIFLADVMANMGEFQTVVIDTYDWLERLLIEDVCAKAQKKGIEDFGYGKGYTYVLEETQKLLKKFDGLIECGINVVLLCHAQMRKFELPEEGGSYDRWELKLSKKTCPVVKEWADMLLFCNYKTLLVTGSDGKSRAQGGKRVMYTSHNPVWDAKNRHGLADELPMDFDSIAGCIPSMNVAVVSSGGNLEEVAQTLEKAKVPKPKKSKAKPETAEDMEYANIPEQLATLMKQDGIKPGWVRDFCAEKWKVPVNLGWAELPPKLFDSLVSNWAKVKDAINSIPEDQRLPF